MASYKIHINQLIWFRDKAKRGMRKKRMGKSLGRVYICTFTGKNEPDPQDTKCDGEEPPESLLTRE